MKKTDYVYCKKTVIMDDTNELAFKRGTVYKVKHYGVTIEAEKTEINDGTTHTIDDNTLGDFFVKHFRYINVKQ